ncbi:hypothetical protein [Telluribacter humicola]|uniref:hypothetical protein n=1 Tax=Telluribacter humicola TaxID=1720261 RepID=UPI001A96CB85|nr:hypothetical protein [Telluribacter humicola]
MQHTIHFPDARFVGAIDPDLHMPGVAIWDRILKKWLCHQSISNDEVLGFLHQNYKRSELVIFLEAGWVHSKANFRGGFGTDAHTIAKNVGENHAMGKFLSGQLKKAGFQVVEIAPLVKKVLKVKGKWTPIGRRHVDTESGIKRMNDDVRDAVWIVMRYR